MTASSLCRKVNALGAFALIAYAAIAALSYLQAPALWPADYYPNAAAFFSGLYGAENFSAIQNLFNGPLAIIFSRWIPVIMATGAAIALILLIRDIERRRDNLIAQRILLWAFAFGAVSFFAYPLYTQDFWLSALWGKMAVNGVNPYHVEFTTETIGALPLDHFPMTMSYGPLWALLSGLVMGIAGQSILVAAILFKAVLLAAWCATLLCVDKLASHFAPGKRSLALILAGWLPLGVLQTVAEGHNDVFLILPVLVWIALLLKDRISAPIALAVSVLCKYATAPLILADTLRTLRQDRASVMHFAMRLVIPGVLTLAIMAIFYRSFAFFDGVRLIGTWEFMRPDDAFDVIVNIVGDWAAPIGPLLLLIFPAIALRQSWIYWRKPSDQNLMRLILATMCFVCFTAVSHVWPWYLVWTLPLAAVIPNWWLSRFIIGMCLIAPFSVVVWWVPEAEHLNNHAALAMYAFAMMWTYLTSDRSRQDRARPLPANVSPLSFEPQKVRNTETTVQLRESVNAITQGEELKQKQAGQVSMNV